MRTRLMEDGDLDQVLDLMRSSLGETPVLMRTTELFRWKHVDNPFGRSIALVAVEGDQIVGLRTFMRWELQTASGERFRCVREHTWAFELQLAARHWSPQSRHCFHSCGSSSLHVRFRLCA